MSERSISQRGLEAQQVLENEAYKQAIDRLKQDVVEKWKNSPIRDKEGQFVLLQLAKVTDKFEAILRGYIEAGKMAQHKIDIDDLRKDTATRGVLRRIVGI